MSSIVQNFIEFSKKKRCSFEADEAFGYIKEFCKSYGYEVNSDSAKNIVATKNSPTTYLQSHYDMVCIGDIPPVVLEKDGCLVAKNSTLGADNGIGIAYMMELIKQKRDLGFIFTADEEVGLIGATELEVEFKGRYLINLDFESEGEVCLSCAGGFDIKASLPLKYQKSENPNTYRVVSTGFSGGHSGINVGRKNAIKELAKFLHQNEANLISIEGGEKINSIPKHSSALVNTNGSIASSSSFGVKKEDNTTKEIKNSKNITELLFALHDGILDYDRELGSVKTSFNISRAEIKDDRFFIEGMGRSNSKEDQLHLKDKTELLLRRFGFDDIKIYSYFEPWDEVDGELKNIALEVFKGFFDSPKPSSIHAGLECGLLAHRFDEVISIGPNIHNPHTKDESAEIDSVEKTYNALSELLDRIER